MATAIACGWKAIWASAFEAGSCRRGPSDGEMAGLAASFEALVVWTRSSWGEQIRAGPKATF
jgi:hypothetical protein